MVEKIYKIIVVTIRPFLIHFDLCICQFVRLDIVCVCVYVCVCVCACVCMCVYMCVCMCVCVRAHVCVSV